MERGPRPRGARRSERRTPRVATAPAPSEDVTKVCGSARRCSTHDVAPVSAGGRGRTGPGSAGILARYAERVARDQRGASRCRGGGAAVSPGELGLPSDRCPLARSGSSCHRLAGWAHRQLAAGIGHPVEATSGSHVRSVVGSVPVGSPSRTTSRVSRRGMAARTAGRGAEGHAES